MLKIWLTWLQPSLGILGAALVLCNPLATYAATKAAPNSVAAKKTPAQSTQWSSLRSNGTRIDSELSSAVAITPDMAVRQMAVGTLSSSSMAAPASIPQIKPIAKAPQQSNRSLIGKFVPPATKVGQISTKAPTKKVGQLVSKATKPRQIDNSVAEALARASKPLPLVPVPGLFIGTADVKLSKQVLPAPKPLAGAIASTEIGAPTPLSAMMGSKPIAADPFPVVRPELMQKIQRTGATMASVPTTKAAPVVSLDPIAAIPTRKNTKVVADIKAIAPNSLDPIANIPSGLQQILGNKLDDREIVATAPSTKTGTNVNSIAAIQQIVAPESTPTISAASLRLATARAYSNSAPKFNIPGETLLTAKSVAPAASAPNFYIPGDSSLAARPTKNVLVTKTVRQPLVTANTRQSNYADIVNETFAPTAKPAWMSADRRNSLGGLILGSQQQHAATTSVVGGFTTPNRNGLQPRTLANFQ
jgi:hypothetical protein